jgi:hypothetical protein
MVATCPSCKGSIPWTKLKKTFSCPVCGAGLSAKTLEPRVNTFVVLVVLDIPLRGLFRQLMGLESFTGAIAHAFAIGAIGFLLASIVFGRFTEVSAR